MPISEYKQTYAGTAGTTSVPNADLGLNTSTDSKTVKINSRSYTQTSGSSIGWQSRVNQTVTTTGDIIGFECQPRVAQGIGCGALIGGKLEPILKGTSGAGTVSEVRGLEIDLTDENVGGRTITNDVAAIRIWQQLAAHTISGDVVVIKVDAAGGATAWEFFAKVPDDGQIASTSGTPTTQAGFLKIKVGSTTKYIHLYTTP